MKVSGWSSSVAARLADSSAGGLLYGAIVTAAVLVTAGGHGSSTRRVLAAWAIVLGIYWLTHVYVHAAENQFHGDTRYLWRRFGSAARGELGVLVGGMPAMVVFLLAASNGRDTLESEELALYFTVAMMAVVGYTGARYVHLSRRAAWGEAAGAALLGLLMVAAKTLLH